MAEYVGNWLISRQRAVPLALTGLLLPLLAAAAMLAGGCSPADPGAIVVKPEGALSIRVEFPRDVAIGKDHDGATRGIVAIPTVARLVLVLDFPANHVDPATMGKSQTFPPARISLTATEDATYVVPLPKQVGLALDDPEKAGLSALLLVVHIQAYLANVSVPVFDGSSEPVDLLNPDLSEILIALHEGAPNRPPFAFATADRLRTAAGNTVHLSAHGSLDQENDSLAFCWRAHNLDTDRAWHSSGMAWDLLLEEVGSYAVSVAVADQPLSLACDELEYNESMSLDDYDPSMALMVVEARSCEGDDACDPGRLCCQEPERGVSICRESCGDKTCAPGECDADNHEVCLEGECVCDAIHGYTRDKDGETCVRDPCFEVDCDAENFEICVDGQCVCDKDNGYHLAGDGQTCTTDPCDPDPCDAANHEICEPDPTADAPDAALCNCDAAAGYHRGGDGQTCTTDLCDPNPCDPDNHEICKVSDTADTPQCLCDAANGWHLSGDGKTCTTDPCDPNPCDAANHKVCNANTDSTTAACDCDAAEGWHLAGDGETCTQDPCDPNPCDSGNHEICQNNLGAAECVCDAAGGWHLSSDRVTCTQDPCDPDPCDAISEVCENGACACNAAAGYHLGGDGVTCTNDPCDPNPCTDRNHEVCENTTGNAVCVCDGANGWHLSGDGVTCTDDPCDPNPCNDANHEVCDNGGGAADCICDAAGGWHLSGDGVTCTQDPCDPDPCDAGNHEVCSPLPVAGFECLCDAADGWHLSADGVTCTQDPCDPDPCNDSNHEVCQDNGGAAECVCDAADGWHLSSNGVTCTQDPCDPDPCDPGNHEICQNNLGVAECVCDAADGWHLSSDGLTCTQDPCDPDPCNAANHEVCDNAAGSADCLCDAADGWHFSADGATCTQDPCDPDPCIPNGADACYERFDDTATCGCVGGQYFVPYTDPIACSTCAGSCGFLPDTGQEECYRATVPSDWMHCPSSPEQAACYQNSGCGQDAQYSSAPLRYAQRQSPEKVVYDETTGLAWQGELPEAPTGCINTSPGTCSWTEAILYCDGLQYAGFDDWRIPTVTELVSLLSIKGNSPFVETTYFPGTSTLTPFWSSQRFITTGETMAWNVHFGEILVEPANATIALHVRCVRNMFYQPGHPAERYTKSTYWTVDNYTGLKWQSGATATPYTTTWEFALADCEQSQHGGYTQWRLPNIKELHSLVDYARQWPAAHSEVIDPLFEEVYWSSTSYPLQPDMALTVDFGEGKLQKLAKNNYAWTLCVGDE